MKTILVVLSIGLAVPCGAQGPVPTCTPPSSSTIAIAYSGLSSGCTPTSGVPCQVGETVHFDLASGANLGSCVIVYTWTFPEGQVAAGAPGQDHQFASTGTFTITLNIASASSAFTAFNVTRPVMVVAPATVPTISPTVVVLLMMALGIIAMARLN
jgi:hypothetical protein